MSCGANFRADLERKNDDDDDDDDDGDDADDDDDGRGGDRRHIHRGGGPFPPLNGEVFFFRLWCSNGAFSILALDSPDCGRPKSDPQRAAFLTPRDFFRGQAHSHKRMEKK